MPIGRFKATLIHYFLLGRWALNYLIAFTCIYKHVKIYLFKYKELMKLITNLIFMLALTASAFANLSTVDEKNIRKFFSEIVDDSDMGFVVLKIIKELEKRNFDKPDEQDRSLELYETHSILNSLSTQLFLHLSLAKERTQRSISSNKSNVDLLREEINTSHDVNDIRRRLECIEDCKAYHHNCKEALMMFEELQGKYCSHFFE